MRTKTVSSNPTQGQRVSTVSDGDRAKDYPGAYLVQSSIFSDGGRVQQHGPNTWRNWSKIKTSRDPPVPSVDGVDGLLKKLRGPEVRSACA